MLSSENRKWVSCEAENRVMIHLVSTHNEWDVILPMMVRHFQSQKYCKHSTYNMDLSDFTYL